MSDIFDIPELAALVDTESDESDAPDELDELDESDAPEEDENGEEISQDDAESERDTSDTVVEEDAVDTSDALGAAVQKALDEERQRVAALQQQLQLQQLHSQAPRPVAFDDLTAEQQEWVMNEAATHGIDPQTVLYNDFQLRRQQHAQQLHAASQGVDSAKSAAHADLKAFVFGNEHVKAMSSDERDAFIQSIGKDDAVTALDALAAVDPLAWCKAVKAIVARTHLAALTAKTMATKGETKARKAMKASLASGSTKATTRVPQPADAAQAYILDAVTSGGGWDAGLRQVKRGR